MVDYVLIPNYEKYWEFIRQVRNDPSIKVGFVKKSYISRESQASYMAKYGDNYYICLRGDDPVGYIGVVNNDIRLAVKSGEQRRGIAKFMLEELMDKHPKAKAKILLGNRKSRLLFESCGFFLTGRDDHFYYYEKPEDDL